MQDPVISIHSVAQSASAKFREARKSHTSGVECLLSLAVAQRGMKPLPSTLRMLEWLLEEATQGSVSQMECCVINVAAAHLGLDLMIRSWKHACTAVLSKVSPDMRADLLMGPATCKDKLTALVAANHGEDKTLFARAIHGIDVMQAGITEPVSDVKFSVYECSQLMSMSAHLVDMSQLTVVVPTRWRFWHVIGRYMSLDVQTKRVDDDTSEVPLAQLHGMTLAFHEKLTQSCASMMNNTLPLEDTTK